MWGPAGLLTCGPTGRGEAPKDVRVHAECALQGWPRMLGLTPHLPEQLFKALVLPPLPQSPVSHHT